MSQRPLALVTGASAGIGAALAAELASRGHDLVLVARRRQRLEALAVNLEDRHGAHSTVLTADLSDPKAPTALVDALSRRELAVDVLVNNAGYGVPGAYLSSDWTVHRDFLQVMATAVAELSWRLAGPMAERGSGRIINIASLAGYLPGTGGHTLYGAVKAWMIRFSESLSFELAGRGVTVCAVCPGFTYSEFHDVIDMRGQVSTLPKAFWMEADEVARQALDAAEAGRRIVIPGRVNRLIAWFGRHLPRSLSYRLLAGQSRRFRNAK